jgi:Family of unknown function (DUF6504)
LLESRPGQGSGRAMRGIRWEPVEVWLRHDKPARFVWRGRLFTVLFVHDRRETARPEPPLSEDASAGGEPVTYVLWRVEATAEKGVPGEIYELLQEPGGERWLLSRRLH